jgi:hypothetical protein
MDTMMSEYYAFTESIKKSGQYIGGEALQRRFIERRLAELRADPVDSRS